MKTEQEITYRGIKLLIEGYYTEPEEEVRYYSDMSGHPGSPSEFDVNAVFLPNNATKDLFNKLPNF